MDRLVTNVLPDQRLSEKAMTNVLSVIRVNKLAKTRNIFKQSAYTKKKKGGWLMDHEQKNPFVLNGLCNMCPDVAHQSFCER